MGRPLGIKNGEKSRFCSIGHDKTITGHVAHNKCRICDHTKTKEDRWLRHGIINSDRSPFTLVDYDREYQIQSGRCKICGVHQAEIHKCFHVDHDHHTGFFRGLLCHHCNCALGNAKDRRDILQSMINYLTRSS